MTMLSVVIPAYNESARIGHTLERVLDCVHHYGWNTEVLVVNDGSTDATPSPAAGANSFTQGQAKARIESRGFANVSDLAKDNTGLWRGKAMKDGKSVNVTLDYQGNVTTN